MNEKIGFYFSVQYSAIQKSILRHDRLWSMSGISMALSRLNEIELGRIARANNGSPLVAGGGKFTACFDDLKNAESARNQCRKIIATKFPMLEFQISDVVSADWMKNALYGTDDPKSNGILRQIGDRKRQFRGYGVTFNPHLMLCEECGEYPVAASRRFRDVRGGDNAGDRVLNLCRICDEAFDISKISLSGLRRKKGQDGKGLTTIEDIYCRYMDGIGDSASSDGMLKVPNNFENLFPPKKKAGSDEERRRMAVWFADINNMKDKVNIWLNQRDVLATFRQVNEVFICIIVNALKQTFKEPKGEWLPFRIVIAGGDDLCLVMAEDHILKFAVYLSECLHKRFEELEKENPNHPLSRTWLTQEAKRIAAKSEKPDQSRELQPYCFGGSFVIASLHTPFRKIHEVGEELMKAAKVQTDRKDNSVNWRIMAEETSQAEQLLEFEKPLFIDEKIEKSNEKPHWDRPSLLAYLDMCKDHKGISSSHRFQIISKMIKERKVPEELELWLMRHASSETEKSFEHMLTDQRLRKNGRLSPERIATLFELMSIKGATDHANK